jgi:hypothetical protein
LEAGHPAQVYSNFTYVNTVIARGGQPALNVVLALLETAPNEQCMSIVGEGPLDDLIKKHGNALVADVEDLAHHDPRFAYALSGVLLPRGVLEPDAEQRLGRWVSVLGR